jgi:hypothetical protein
MPYILTKSDGTTLTTVNDATLDITTNLTFVGRNYSGYGQTIDQNFVKLLENFANNIAPTKPIQGQLWFDKTVPNNPKLKICYDGKNFKNVVSVPFSISTSPLPSNPVDGDLLYVTDLNQIQVYVGGSWQVPSTFSTARLVPGSAPSNPLAGTMAVADGVNWNPVIDSRQDGLQHLMIYLNGAWVPVV